jgi:hypothetical protein
MVSLPEIEGIGARSASSTANSEPRSLASKPTGWCRSRRAATVEQPAGTVVTGELTRRAASGPSTAIGES